MIAKDSVAYPTLAVIQHFGLEQYAGDIYNLSYLIGCELTDTQPAYKLESDKLIAYLELQIGSHKFDMVMRKVIENERRACYAVAGYVKKDMWLNPISGMGARGIPVGPMLYN